MIFGMLLYASLVRRRLKRIRLELIAEEKALEGVRNTLLHAQGRWVGDDEVAEWVGGAPERGLLRRAIGAIWAARVIPNPDLEAIGTMLAQSEEARLGSLRGAPNRLLLAGLLGTVFGLAGMVGTLGPQIEGTLTTADPLLLTRSLGITLTHMQNAFACTAWGILTAIFVGWQTSRVASRQSNLLAEVEDFGLRQFAPRVFPRSQAAQLDDLRAILHESQQFLASVGGLMKESAREFSDILKLAGDSMHQSVQQLSGVATGIQQTLSDVAHEVGETADAMKESAGSVNESARSLDGCNRDLRNAYQELRRLFEESSADLQRKADEQLSAIQGLQQRQLEEIGRHQQEQLAQMGRLQQDFGATAEAIVGRVDSAAQALNQSVAAFRGVGDGFRSMGLEVTQRLDRGFDHVTEQMTGLLTDHRKEMGQVEASLRLISDRMEALSERLDPRLLPSGQWAAVRDALTTAAEELKRLQADRSDLGARLETGFGVLSNRVGADLETYRAGIQDTLTELRSIGQSLSLFLDRLQTVGDASGRPGTTSLDASLSDLTGELRRLQEQLVPPGSPIERPTAVPGAIRPNGAPASSPPTSPAPLATVPLAIELSAIHSTLRSQDVRAELNQIQHGLLAIQQALAARGRSGSPTSPPLPPNPPPRETSAPAGTDDRSPGVGPQSPSQAKRGKRWSWPWLKR